MRFPSLRPFGRPYPQGAEHLCDLGWQYELVTSEEAGELRR